MYADERHCNGCGCFEQDGYAGWSVVILPRQISKTPDKLSKRCTGHQIKRMFVIPEKRTNPMLTMLLWRMMRVLVYGYARTPK